MKRKNQRGWEAHQLDSIRHRVAVEAARLLYHREMKEYFHAKREAARRQGTPHLPSNREVHDELLRIARKIEGDEHEQRLTQMRAQALILMEQLERFHPRLIGSVLTGHIRRGSDIDLHIHTENVDEVSDALSACGYEHAVEVVTSRKDGEVQDFVHVRMADLGGFEVEMTVYPPEWLYTTPRCGITGGPMRRGTLAEVRQLMAAASVPPVQTWSLPLDMERLCSVLPELAACRGVLQNTYHHLDVFEHTVEVVRGLERMIASGYERFGPWAPHLRQHLEPPASAALLALTGACHDLGKPQTQSWDRSGRIRFIGHDDLGAEIVRRVGPRLGLEGAQVEDLARLVEWHLEAVMIPVEGMLPSRIHKLMQGVGQRLPELALLSLADVEAARGPAQTAVRLEDHQRFVDLLLEQFFGSGSLAAPELPLTPEDLIEEFGRLAPKQQSRLWDRLLADYLDGEWSSREEGLSIAAELLAQD